MSRHRRTGPGAARPPALAGVWLLVLALHAGLWWALTADSPPDDRTTPPTAAPVTSWLRLVPPPEAADERPANRQDEASTTPAVQPAEQPKPGPMQRPSPAAPKAALGQAITLPAGTSGLVPDTRGAVADTTRAPAVASGLPAPTDAAPGATADRSAIASALGSATDSAAAAPTRRASDPPPSTVAATPTPPPLNLALPRPASRANAEPPAAWVRGDPAVHPAPTSRDDRLAAALGTDTRLHMARRGPDVVRFTQGRGCVDVRPARNAQLDPYNQSSNPSPQAAAPC